MAYLGGSYSRGVIMDPNGRLSMQTGPCRGHPGFGFPPPQSSEADVARLEQRASGLCDLSSCASPPSPTAEQAHLLLPSQRGPMVPMPMPHPNFGHNFGAYGAPPERKLSSLPFVLGLMILAALAVVAYLFSASSPLEQQQQWAATSSTTPAAFTCDASEDIWLAAQREWCCSNMGMGCPSAAQSQSAFRCDGGFGNDVSGWSDKKRSWCCANEGKGCAPIPASAAAAPSTPVALGTPYQCQDDTRAADWTVGKRVWCCQHEDKGCGDPKATKPPHDCHTGEANWKLGWSEAKKKWCCDHADVGCEAQAADPAKEDLDCDKGFEDWRTGWKDEKKSWCCKTAGKGCSMSAGAGPTVVAAAPDAFAHISNPYDCDSGKEVTWSLGKEAWCCQHKQKGCSI